LKTTFNRSRDITTIPRQSKRQFIDSVGKSRHKRVSNRLVHENQFDGSATLAAERQRAFDTLAHSHVEVGRRSAWWRWWTVLWGEETSKR